MKNDELIKNFFVIILLILANGSTTRTIMQFSQRQEKLENKSLYISCIIPVYNEELVIEAFISELNNTLKQLTNQFEIIVIDDGSKDLTVQKLQPLSQQYPIKRLVLSRNFGKEIALTAGIDHCSGEVAILMDADFQHPLTMLSTFLNYWTEGYDMVFGTRTNRYSESYFKRNFAKFFYWMMQKITEVNIPPNAGDFRLLDRRVIDALKQFPERTRFMKGLYAWVGFKKISVPFTVDERAGGQSSWRFSKLTELAITGITSFSSIPLRVWGLVGFIISLIALLYAIYIVAVTMIYGADLPGFPTLVVAIMFLGGVQLLSIGILGEYIARIFTEVKQRPRYLIQFKDGFEE